MLIESALVPPQGEREKATRLRTAKKDWADLEAAWPEDDYEELQQRAIQERLGLVEAHAAQALLRALE